MNTASFSALSAENKVACYIALVNALVPLVAVFGAYAIALWQQAAPACNPFTEGCTSISRAARSGDAIFWFRPLMMPLAPLILVYWVLQRNWLIALIGRRTRELDVILWLSVFSTLALVLYVNFLGSEGPFYNFMRRQGVMFYFGFTGIAQLLSLHVIYTHRQKIPVVLQRAIRWQWVAVVFQWVLGLASVAVSVLQLSNRSEANNVIEWWFALAMVSFYAVSVYLWRVAPPKWRIGRDSDAASQCH